jgi:RecJ-like exonuclease
MILSVPCPLCQGKGSVPYQAVASEPACATRCPLCWGLGCIPVLEVVIEGRKALALHYWLCDCTQQDHHIHPSNHDVCPTCDLSEDRANQALAEDVQAFFQNGYNLRLELVEVT